MAILRFLLSTDSSFPSLFRSPQEAKLEKELADEMTGHIVNGIPAETPPTHRPLALTRTVEGETPLMAAAGCPSPACVELVSVRGTEGRGREGKIHWAWT